MSQTGRSVRSALAAPRARQCPPPGLNSRNTVFTKTITVRLGSPSPAVTGDVTSSSLEAERVRGLLADTGDVVTLGRQQRQVLRPGSCSVHATWCPSVPTFLGVSLSIREVGTASVTSWSLQSEGHSGRRVLTTPKIAALA